MPEETVCNCSVTTRHLRLCWAQKRRSIDTRRTQRAPMTPDQVRNGLWAQRLKRALNINIKTCPVCGGVPADLRSHCRSARRATAMGLGYTGRRHTGCVPWPGGVTKRLQAPDQAIKVARWVIGKPLKYL